MSQERAKRAEAIFLEVMDQAGAAREVALHLRCNGDAALRREVEMLLRFHDCEAGLLDAPPVVGSALSGIATHASADSLAPGTRLGEYTIEGTLGEGGMGVVYIARQERPSRTVALKVIRRGLASASLVRRFEHEAEVLGLLQHPGIAQIFGAGAVSIVGQESKGPVPYIAMELINGPRLTDYSAPLTTREKLEVMAKVCAAVHHAHQRGVIHRDLKPANILVGTDGPKVLDFGVARASDADLRVTTLQTGVGQLIGTLPYMSPEQVLADPAAIDTRSDVYSLGVILYQLLTGRLPHDLSSRSIPEAARVIRDEEPTKLSSVSRVFRGDIDTIVAKAIEKDVTRRYQSAAALGDDLERHLRGEPIAARGDSPLYVLRKQLRRYRMAVAGVSIIAGLLIAFAAYALVQAQRGREQALREHGLKLKADETAARLADELAFSSVDRGRLMVLSGNTIGGERMLWSQLLEHPNLRTAHWGLWELYSKWPVLKTLPDQDYARCAPAFSTDGSIVALGRTDHSVALMTEDLARELVRTPPLRSDARCVVLGEGNLLVVGTNGGSVQLFDSRTGDPIRTYRLHSGPVTSLGFGPAGTPAEGLILSGSRDGAAWVESVSDGELVREFKAPKDALGGRTDSGVIGAAFTPDGQNVLLTYVRGGVSLVRFADASPIARSCQNELLASFALTPDGHTAYVGANERVLVLEVPSLQVLGEIHVSSREVRSLSLFAKAEPKAAVLLAAGNRGLDVIDVDAAGGHVRASFSTGDPVMGTLRPDGARFILTSLYGKVQEWDLPDHDASSPAVRVLGRAEGWVLGTLLTGNHFYTASIGSRGSGGAVIRWDLQAQVATKLEAPTAAFRTICLSPDGSVIAAATSDGQIHTWDATTLAPLRSFSTGIELSSICFAPGDDAFVLAPSRKGAQVVIAPLDGTTPRVLEGVIGPVLSTRRRPGSTQFLTSGGGTPPLAVWDGSSLKLAMSAEPGQLVAQATFSRDGALIAAPGRSRSAEVRDASTLEVKARMVGHAEMVLCTAFSPDSSMLATSDIDGTVMLWEVATGRALATVLQVDDQLSTLVFTEDGRSLVAAGQSGVIRVIDLTHYDRHIAGNAEYIRTWFQKVEGRTFGSSESVPSDK